MNEIRSVSNLIYWFQTFRKINIATFLHVKLSKSLLNKWLYCTIPIILFSVNIFNLVRSGVLYSPCDKFTYFDDLSNSLCLTLLYFLSYFLSGYYPSKLDEFVQKGIEKEFFYKMAKYRKSKKRSHFLLVFIGIMLCGMGVASGYSFYSVAKSNINVYWIHNLDGFGRMYYCLFLGITWYHSLSLLGMALTSGFIVYKVIEYNHLIYIENDFNNNISIIKAIDIVISTFSYGLFYIIGSFIFIFNDRIAEDYGIHNTFCGDIPALILVLAITLLVVLAYLPLQELFSFMKVKKAVLINSLNEMIISEEMPEKKEEIILKRNDLIKQNLIYTTMANKITFILSIFIPLVGVIFQAIDLFRNN